MKIIFFTFFLVSTTFLNVFAIKIIGNYTDNFPISKKVRLHSIDRILNIEKTLISVDLDRNNNFEINFELDKSGIFFLNETIVFISKFDSVSLLISNSKIIEAKGNNSGNYLYYSKVRPYYHVSKKILSISNFDINKVIEDTENEYLFVNKGMASLDISEEFKKYIYSDIWFENINYHLSSLNISKVPIDLNKIELKENNKNSSFQSSLIYSIIESINISSKSFQNSSDLLLKIKSFSNFSQFSKELILSRIFQRLVQERPHSGDTFYFGKHCKEYLSDKTIIEHFNKNWNLLVKLTNQIPDRVKKTQLKDYYGNKLTFENILSKNSDKIIYIDIWAKWCGACIYEFPIIKDLKQKYITSNFETIGISKDNEFIDFKKAVDKYNLNVQNQYFLVNEGNIEFNSYFEIEELPKYFLFDKGGVPLNFDSIRPNNKKLYKLVSFYLDLPITD